MEFVLRFFYNLTGNYGISIILLTVVVRLALYPVIHKQNVSARAMQEIQPEVKKLQEKYAKEPQKLNQEIMKLYKEKGVSPLGGCLPLLIQLPFLFVLYRVLVTYDYGQAGFLWLPSLSQKDPYYILPLAMGVTTFLQQKMSPPSLSGEASQQNLLLLVAMPVFLVFISWGLPSGVLLYWFVSNLFYIFQQYMLEVQIRKSKTSLSLNVATPGGASITQETSKAPVKKKGGKKGEKKHEKKR